MEACLQGKALSSYWTLVDEADRATYECAKRSVLRCLGPPTTSKLERVFNSQWTREETITEAFEECVQHVKSFRTEGDTVDEITFKWTLVRMLGKCKKECAELVWKEKPKPVPEAVALIRDWEHHNGHPAKVWVQKFKGHTDRRRTGSSRRLWSPR